MIQYDETYSTGYKIGTAAKMAGISPNTIRTWMRRDYFRASIESDSGERILSSDDLKRLINIKSLIEMGDSIGRIATLSDAELQDRLAELRSTSEQSYASDLPSLADLEAAFVSPPESVRLAAAAPLFWKSKRFATLDELVAHIDEAIASAQIVIIDYQAANSGTGEALVQFAKDHPEVPTVVLFDFLQQSVLKELARMQIHLLRWPVNSIMLERQLYSILPTLAMPGNASFASKEAPQRLLTERQLSVLANTTSKLHCECPRHASTVVNSLGAFEDYNKRCISTSPEDRELHEYLHYETARARRIMELALIRLCKEDGIEIPAP